MDSIFPKSTLMISGPWRKSKQKSFMKQRPASRIQQRRQPFITIIIFIQNQQEPISKQGVTQPWHPPIDSSNFMQIWKPRCSKIPSGLHLQIRPNFPPQSASHGRSISMVSSKPAT
ncbi:hypothetical protein ACLOJK_005964 [Asimina triloba]